ncbi:hypothetical protein ACT453_38475, partial [Bacillus sp. D-CC]
QMKQIIIEEAKKKVEEAKDKMGENFKATLEQLGLKNEDELKEKMKQEMFKGSFVETKPKAPKTSIVRVFGEGILFLIFGVVVVGPIIAFVITIFTGFAEK